MLAEEKTIEVAEEVATEELLRKNAAVAKKKKVVALSAEQTTDPSEDIYLAAFQAGASLEILGDLRQLKA